MNKMTLALATSTVGLALASAYLWKQLDAERDRAKLAVTQGAQLQARLAKLEHEQHSAPVPDIAKTIAPKQSVAQALPVAPRPAVTDASDVDENARLNARHQKQWQEARRRILEDPHGRELLEAQARSKARADNSDLARELQLTDAEFDRLVELLAEHDLQVADVYSRADSGITAEMVNETQALRDRLGQDIADMLGSEKAQQYAAFEDSGQVRTQARRLRGLLSEGDALTDVQNQRLIAALNKQRLSFNEEMQRRVPKERVVGSRGTWDGGLFLADRASTLPAQEQYLKQIEEFRKRQRQGAAEVLTARQLRVLAQMQDEMLTQERLDARTWALVDQSN